MQLTICQDPEAAALRLADTIEQAVADKPNLVMGLATGRASSGAYKELARRHYQKMSLSFRHAIAFNTDEFIGMQRWDPRSTRYFMNTNFFNLVDLPLENTFVPNGSSGDLQAECKAYDFLIQSHGGLDLVVLGLGHNGHVGFNEPGSSIKSKTRVVEFTESTLAALSGGHRFRNLDETPRSAITMGLGTIMSARHLLLIATGIGKAEAVHKMLDGKPGPSVPASQLLSHPRISVILDQDSALQVKNMPGDVERA